MKLADPADVAAARSPTSRVLRGLLWCEKEPTWARFEDMRLDVEWGGQVHGLEGAARPGRR